MRIAVAGSTGFVGSALVTALDEAGHEVIALTRDPDRHDGPGRAAEADVETGEGLDEALAGAQVAYYLVHGLGGEDFEAVDRRAADHFATAAAKAGVDRIVYLGGLGRDGDDLSPHLRSRREVEGVLATTGVPVTVVRAAVVLGADGVSWRLTRDLATTLPIMVGPQWLSTKTQPIALRDVVRVLTLCADRPEAQGRVFEVGGPDVVTYADMLRVAARVEQDRRLFVLTVPFLTPRLSARFVPLFSDVDATTAVNLAESMDNEAVVTSDAIRDLCDPDEFLGHEDAVRAAVAAARQRSQD